jgi:hypothetical protein
MGFRIFSLSILIISASAHGLDTAKCEKDLARLDAGLSCMIGNTTTQCLANYQSVFVDGKSTAPYKDYAFPATQRNGMQTAEPPKELDSILWTLRPKILDEAKKCGMNTDGPGDPLGMRKPNPNGGPQDSPADSTQ